jgi:hypothetical protein
MSARPDLPSLPPPAVVGTCEPCGRTFTARFGFAMHRCADGKRPAADVASPLEIIEAQQEIRDRIIFEAIS